MPAVKSGGGRPQAYKLASGVRVPGVTTITSRFKEAGGLVHWAWSLGIEGKDYRKVRDEAADAGSFAHDWIEDTIHERPLTEFPHAAPELLARAQTAVDAFKRWRDQVKLEVVETEVPLISELHRFGGTFDAIFRIGGELHLGDWKSGNRIYPEHVVQLGGYSLLLRERGTEVVGAQLLRVDKEHASFSHFGWPKSVLELGELTFLRQRELYDLDARLKRVAT
jgi:predicted RecB family nuclease